MTVGKTCFLTTLSRAKCLNVSLNLKFSVFLFRVYILKHQIQYICRFKLLQNDIKLNLNVLKRYWFILKHNKIHAVSFLRCHLTGQCSKLFPNLSVKLAWLCLHRTRRIAKQKMIDAEA